MDWDCLVAFVGVKLIDLCRFGLCFLDKRDDDDLV